MYTDYATLKSVPFDQLLDGRLERWGVKPVYTDDNGRVLLSDGNSFMWAYRTENDSLSCVRHTQNKPTHILNAVSEAFESELVSGDDRRFWGCDSGSEQDQNDWWSCYDRRILYFKLMNFLKTGTHGFHVWTPGEVYMLVGKKLVESNPEFARPEKREDLLSAIEEIAMDKATLIEIGLLDPDIPF
jgi:hypothetical protein